MFSVVVFLVVQSLPCRGADSSCALTMRHACTVPLLPFSSSFSIPLPPSSSLPTGARACAASPRTLDTACATPIPGETCVMSAWRPRTLDRWPPWCVTWSTCSESTTSGRLSRYDSSSGRKVAQPDCACMRLHANARARARTHTHTHTNTRTHRSWLRARRRTLQPKKMASGYNFQLACRLVRTKLTDQDRACRSRVERVVAKVLATSM